MNIIMISSFKVSDWDNQILTPSSRGSLLTVNCPFLCNFTHNLWESSISLAMSGITLPGLALSPCSYKLAWMGELLSPGSQRSQTSTVKMFYTWYIDQFAGTNSIVMNGEGDRVNVSEVHATCKLQMKYSPTQKSPVQWIKIILQAQ